MMSESPQQNTQQEAASLSEPGQASPSLSSLVGQVVHSVDKVLSPGDVAELRRLKPHDPSAPVFYKLMAATVDKEGQLPSGAAARDAAEQRWASICQLAASCSGLHNPKQRLGAALAQADLSELRFVRLLRADGEGLYSEVRRIGQFLASKAQPFDLTDMARLVLVRDEEKAESLRRSIARAFYGQQQRDSKK